MEAGWMQDYFYKNSLEINRAYKCYVNKIKEGKEIIDIQLDLYKLINNDKEIKYRMIVAFIYNNNIEIGDGYVIIKNLEAIFINNSYAQFRNITFNFINKNEFDESAEFKEAVFNFPIKEKFVIVKNKESTHLCKFEFGKLETIYAF